MSEVIPWTITGAAGEPILGDAHRCPGLPRGVVVIAHGFKGYKDYGMFPAIARVFEDAGFLAHRFNFSHSGMTNRVQTFERPDLFERDTWNMQVTDLHAVLRAVHDGTLPGQGLPTVLLGHSRGGATVLLTMGRLAGDRSGLPDIRGVVSISAPSRCEALTPEQSEQLMRDGRLPSPSSRTGQTLHIGRAFLQEQRDDPAAHDLPKLVGRITCPLLVIHGRQDPTVPVAAAEVIAAAAVAPVTTRIIEDADHVFNTPNPMPPDQPRSPQLQELLAAAIGFTASCCE